MAVEKNVNINVTANTGQAQGALAATDKQVQGLGASVEAQSRRSVSGFARMGAAIKEATAPLRGFLSALRGIVGIFATIGGIIAFVSSALSLLSGIFGKASEEAAEFAKNLKDLDYSARSLGQRAGNAALGRWVVAEIEKLKAIEDAPAVMGFTRGQLGFEDAVEARRQREQLEKNARHSIGVIDTRREATEEWQRRMLDVTQQSFETRRR